MNPKDMSFEATLTIDKEVMSSLAKYLKETDDEILDGIFSGKQGLILHNPKRGTAELSRVVRCKDCIHFINHDKRCGYFNHGIKTDDYCSFGKRKDNE